MHQMLASMRAQMDIVTITVSGENLGLGRNWSLQGQRRQTTNMASYIPHVNCFLMHVLVAVSAWQLEFKHPV